MSTRDVSVGVNLIGRDISASKALNKLGNAAKTTGDKFAAASRKSTYILGALTASAAVFAKAAAEDQLSASKLATTLKTITNAGADQVAQVEKFIGKSELWSATADDKIRPAFDRLVRSTRNIAEAQKLTTLALEISRQKGLPVVDVANALAKAHDGNVNALKKIGVAVKTATKGQDVYGVRMKVVNGKLEETRIKLKSAAKETVKFDDVVKQLGKDFNGSINAQADTAAFKMEQFRVVIGRIQETLGYLLLPYLTKLSDWLIKYTPWIESHAKVIGQWALAIGAVAAAIKVVSVALKAWETLVAIAGMAKVIALWAGFGKTVTVAGAEIAAAGAAAEVAWLPFLGTVGAIVAAFVLLNKAIDYFSKKREALLNDPRKMPSWTSESNKFFPDTSISAVPQHAKGGIVTKPQIGMIGEAGPEAIIPLSKFGSLGGTTIVNNIQGSVITQKELAIMTRDSMAQLLRRKGINPVILGV